jgi:hypothetical protein
MDANGAFFVKDPRLLLSEQIRAAPRPWPSPRRLFSIWCVWSNP